MKQTTRIAALILAAVMALGAGCATQTTPANDVPQIGIIQLVTHKALDDAREGFIAALAENGFNDGAEINIDFQNAMGDMSNLSTISDQFVNGGVDLVLAIATPAAQAIASKTAEIPIVATAVTSFADAGLAESDEAPGANVTGTSDMNPVAAQIGLIKDFFPDAATIGLIYNSGESNSVLQIDIAKEAAAALGLEWVEATVTSTNDVQQVMQSLVTECDVIYLPTDNTISSSMATVSAVAIEAGIPTICGESNQVLEGGLIAMGINYFDIGFNAGLMAVEILNGANPAEMAIRFADDSGDIAINGFTAEELGFTVPEAFAEFVVFPEAE
ncbi:MAG: ABC transporter substrate-binding protein [Clostridiales bacterium]|jgi:putative ABC transport system substrate-binding protein|nr:ABC transporter substrate-binding protein [Clostridiales bacterium]